MKRDRDYTMILTVILIATYVMLVAWGCTTEEIPLTCEQENQIIQDRIDELKCGWGKLDKSTYKEIVKLEQQLKECE